MLRFVFKFFLFISFCAAILAGTWIIAPDLYINQRTLGFCKLLLERFHAGISWSEGTVSIASESLLVKRLDLTLKDIRIRKESFNAELPLFHIQGSLSLKLRENLFQDIGPIELLSKQVVLQPAPDSSAEDRSWNFRPWINFARQTIKGPIQIQVESFQSPSFSGRFTIAMTRSLSDQYSLQVDADNLKDLFFQRANLKLTKASNSESFQISLDGFYADPKGNNAVLAARGRADTQTFTGQWSLNERSRQMGEIQLNTCSLQASSEDFFSLRGKAETQCQGQVKDAKLLSQLPLGMKGISKLLFNLNANLKWFSEKGRDTIVGHAQVHLPSFKQGPLRIGGTADFDGRWDGRPDYSRFTMNISNFIEVPKFQELVASLRQTTHPIPAPFHHLQGSLLCNVSGEVTFTGMRFEAPFQCTSDLHSKSQSIGAFAKGQVIGVFDGARPKIELQTQLTANDVQLVFPELGQVTQLPRLTRDPRIDRTANIEKKAVSRAIDFKYDIKITTKASHPIRILNVPYTQSIVPIALNIELVSERPMIGTIDIGHVDLVFLRRKATIDSVRLTYNNDDVIDRSAALKGEVRVVNTEVTVHVQILGTVKKPVFVLHSEPPLPESELVPLLVYGQSPDLLTDSEQQSSESVRAALAERAIGLASMYYLASTPIESVSYNPASRVFTARVSISKNVSLSLGSDAENTNIVGIQRRINQSWSFETTAEDEGIHRRGVAMLRWARRY